MSETNVEKFYLEIQKEKSDIPFTVIPNNVLQNFRDGRALSVWCYLQSLPANWKICKAHLSAHFGYKDHTYKLVMASLKQHNLVRYEPIRTNKGTVVGTRVIVLNGTAFTGSAKINTEDASQELSTGHSHRECVLPTLGSADGRLNAPLINNIDIKKQTQNKKQTTTTLNPLRLVDESPKGDESFRSGGGFCDVDIQILKEKFGATDGYADQLLSTGAPPLAINESIRNFVKMMSNDRVSSRIKDKLAYFLSAMRKAKFFSIPETEAECNARCDANLAKQEEIRRSKELAQKERDREYGLITADQLRKGVDGLPTSIQDILKSHVAALDPNCSLKLTVNA